MHIYTKCNTALFERLFDMSSDQLNMYKSWQKFCSESTFALTGKFTCVFKKSILSIDFKLEIKTLNWYEFM